MHLVFCHVFEVSSIEELLRLGLLAVLAFITFSLHLLIVSVLYLNST